MIKKFEKKYKNIFHDFPSIFLKFDVHQSLSPSILLNSMDFTQNMHDIYKKFNIRLEYDSKVARCSKCNSNIKIIEEKNEIKNKVPDSVYQSIDKYWICQNKNCNKIYWIGGHFEDIFNKLNQIKNSI
jgi:uncharacterized protein with PIN domain